MKTFLNFIKEADVPTNVAGAAVSTDQPVATKKSSNKYKRRNMAAAPKPIGEADVGAAGDSYVTPNDANLYIQRNVKDTLKISKE